MRLPGLFITGTDTGIGKTWVTQALMAGFISQGKKTLGMKPVASGCQQTPEGLRNEDALAIQSAASWRLEYSRVNPYAFEPAIAPHIAAAEAGVELSLESMARQAQQLRAKCDVLVVEGVGGWLVPLDAKSTVADLARCLELPLVLVVGMRLGCLNHALLSAESIMASGLPFLGWIANCIEPEYSRAEENLQTLKERMPVSYLGQMPYAESVEAAISGVDFDWNRF